MRQLRNGLCMFAILRVNGKDKRFKCLWTGYCSRCQSHWFVSRTATLLGFSRSTVSHVYQEWSHPKDIQPTWQQWEAVESTWASIPMERFQHLVESHFRDIELSKLRENVIQYTCFLVDYIVYSGAKKYLVSHQLCKFSHLYIWERPVIFIIGTLQLWQTKWEKKIQKITL